MAQKLSPFTVTVTTAGTRQRVITSATDALRFVKSATFTAFHTNTGDIYVGNSSVSSSLYTDRLEAKQQGVLEGDEINREPGHDNNLVDLYETYVDSSVNGEKVNVSVQVRS